MAKESLKSNIIIYSAILKYGHSNFNLEIIEYCESTEKILERENYYLDLLNPEYNVLQKAGSSLGRLHTEDTKAKIRASLIGRKIPKETRDAMLKGSTVRVGVRIVDLLTGTSNEYLSIREAAREIGESEGSLIWYSRTAMKAPFKKRYLLIRLV